MDPGVVLRGTDRGVTSAIGRSPVPSEPGPRGAQRPSPSVHVSAGRRLTVPSRTPILPGGSCVRVTVGLSTTTGPVSLSSPSRSRPLIPHSLSPPTRYETRVPLPESSFGESGFPGVTGVIFLAYRIQLDSTVERSGRWVDNCQTRSHGSVYEVVGTCVCECVSDMDVVVWGVLA